MTIEDMMKEIDALINSDGAADIPGLDLESIVDNFINVKYRKDLEAVEDKDECETLREQWRTYYLKGEGRIILTTEINSVRANFSAIKNGLVSINKAVIQTTASNTIPSVITVGTATSAPNPAYAMIENAQKKETLLGLIKTTETFAINLLTSAIRLSFEIPDSVGGVIKTIATTKTAINLIPT